MRRALVMLYGLVLIAWLQAPCVRGEERTIVVGGEGPNSAKTLAEGAARLQPGWTLEIMPNTYHEAIRVRCDDVRIEARGPGVVLDGSIGVKAAAFTPVEGRKGVFAWPLPANAFMAAPWVFVGRDMLLCHRRPLEEADRMYFFMDREARMLQVNIDGESLPTNTVVRVPTIKSLLDLNRRRNVRVRGLELIRAAGTAIEARDTQGARIEYCVIRQAGDNGISGGHDGVFSRNVIKLCNGNAIHFGGSGSLVEENLLVANGLGWTGARNWVGGFKQNHGGHCTYRHNWVVDQLPRRVKVGPQIKEFSRYGGTGFWFTLDCYNNTLVCNSLARLPRAGIFIEHFANRNVLLYNAVQDCAAGLVFLEGSANLAARNWIWDSAFFGLPRAAPDDDEAPSGINLLGTHTGQTRDNCVVQNLVQVSGHAVKVPIDAREGAWPREEERARRPPPAVLSNQLSANYYGRSPQDATFALLGTAVMPTLERYQGRSGWDLNAESGPFSPAVLGLTPLWTVPWAALDLKTPVAMLYDPSLEMASSTDSKLPLFWHGSHVKTGPASSPPATAYSTGGRAGGKCLQVWNTVKRGDKAVDASPAWTSAAIPVKPGTTMHVSLWIKADDVRPAEQEAGCVVAAVLFEGPTGFVVEEKALVGWGTNPKLAAGSYDWTRVQEDVKVPAGSAWMIVAGALEPGEGKAYFDDVVVNLKNPAPPALTAGGP
ncbi:MAG: right-handed parallel beta-helix repeat-containing protein [Kiritimatiellae bacterium]|nr:right-handed parallel beta-helix repeat-containing protein [Kiritimatiellia bacterium]